MLSYTTSIRALLRYLGAIYSGQDDAAREETQGYLMFERGFLAEHAEFLVNIIPSNEFWILLDGKPLIRLFSMDYCCELSTRCSSRLGFDKFLFIGDDASSVKLTVQSQWRTGNLCTTYIDSILPEESGNLDWRPGFAETLYELSLGNPKALEIFLQTKELSWQNELKDGWERTYKSFKQHNA